ncbi:MAG: FmdB family zinc ribbon protein [Bryobacteraceae bacterium]
MPVYEYHCEDCKGRFNVLVKRIGQEAEACPYCRGTRLTRLWSRFAMTRSEEDRLDRLADDAELAGLDENDPKSVARFMKKMGQELGEDAGEDFEQAMEELERGEEGERGFTTGAENQADG